jgi:hypothetical protein
MNFYASEMKAAKGRKNTNIWSRGERKRAKSEGHKKRKEYP